jgi:hypothetical protein
MYPGLFHAAQLSWNGQEIDEASLGGAIDCWAYGKPGDGLGKWMIQLGKLDQTMDSYIPNSSMHWTLLFGFHEERFGKFFEEQASAQKLHQGLEYLEQLDGETPSSSRSNGVQKSLDETRLALQMTRVSLERGTAFAQEKEYAVAGREEMVREFERLWKVRAREGGLREASKLLKDALN